MEELLTIPKSTAQAIVDALVETKIGKAAFLLGSTLKVKPSPRTENDILMEHQLEKLKKHG